MLPVNISIQQVKEGMITADDILSPSGFLIIPKNTPMTPRLVSRLKLYNVKSIYVIITESMAEELNAAVAKEKPVNPMRETKEFKVFHRSYEDLAGKLEAAFQQIISTPDAPFDLAPVIDPILQLASTVKNTLHLMNTLQLLREYEDTMFIHSISVALISHTIALQLGLSEEEIYNLMIASAFHDIGKMQIPAEVLNKPGKLTDEEYEIIKQHPKKGYQILSRAHFPNEILMAALLHHERCDGTGYPTSATLQAIPLFARIIAIADVYDAMTARRSYRKGICSFDVIANFEETGYQKYDATVLIPFLTSIAQSHINAQCRLSNSLIGTIVMINKQKLSRPVVNVDGTFFDLSKEKDLTILEII